MALRSGHSSNLSKYLTGLISCAIGGKMPGGFNISSAKSHLSKTWGLGPQRTDTMLLIATSVSGRYDSPFSFHLPALINQPVISQKQPFSEIEDDGHKRLSSSAGGSASQPQGSILQTLHHGTLQQHRCGSHHSTIFTPFQQHSRAFQAQGPPHTQTQPWRASLHSLFHLVPQSSTISGTNKKPTTTTIANTTASSNPVRNTKDDDLFNHLDLQYNVERKLSEEGSITNSLTMLTTIP